MPRKKAETLEQQRVQIRKKYRDGARGSRAREIISFDSLSDEEKGAKKEAACFLKAADYSHTYIGEALGTTRGVVKKWFEEPSMRARVLAIQADYIDGAVKLLKTYAIELVEMLVEIARDGLIDPKVRIQAITEALDRMGMSKVNKSESAVSKKTEVDIVDRTGLLSAMQTADPEVQQEMARKLDEAFALAAEHTDKDVTHA